MTNKKIFVLGVESSCDETSAAVVATENDISEAKVLSNVIYSQIDEHKIFGGVVPEIAARAHLEKIDLVVKKAVDDAGISLHEISAVAGTCGPGLIGGLIVGATFAKSVSLALSVPFLAINHIEAHAISARIENDLRFPYLLMLASGGHCQIWIVHDINKFEVLGRTIDDSVGESFDKVAKMLDIGYPGGPIIEKLAKNGDAKKFQLPRPLCTKNQEGIGCDFSFSGLKTAVRAISLKNSLSEKDKTDLCASFQYTVAEILKYKIRRALKYCTSKGINLNALVISGGVAANEFIKSELTKIAAANKMQFFAPSKKYCTDNGAMIAWLGMEKFMKNQIGTLDAQIFPRNSM